MGVFQNLFSSKDRPILEVIPITNVEDTFFRLRDGTIFDMVQVVTRDLTSLSDDDIQYDNLTIVKFLRLYAEDFKICSLSFPTDTKSQKQYLERKIAKTKNSVFLHFLEYKLEELKYIEKNKTELEFYIFIFAKSPEELKNKYSILQSSLGVTGFYDEIELEKKIQILYKLNNKNTNILLTD